MLPAIAKKKVIPIMCSVQESQKQREQTQDTEDADVPTSVESPLAQLRARLEAQHLRRLEAGEGFECAGCALADAGVCH